MRNILAIAILFLTFSATAQTRFATATNLPTQLTADLISYPTSIGSFKAGSPLAVWCRLNGTNDVTTNIVHVGLQFSFDGTNYGTQVWPCLFYPVGTNRLILRTNIPAEIGSIASRLRIYNITNANQTSVTNFAIWFSREY